MEEIKKYQFKNDFLFVESGNTRHDLYMAIKDELGYFLEKKSKIYLDKLSESFDFKLSCFFGDMSSILNRIVIVLTDNKINNLRQYIEYGERGFNKALYSETAIKEHKIVFESLAYIDRTISRLTNDIISVKLEAHLEQNRGVFVLINDYFNKFNKKIFEKFDDVLIENYDFIYEKVRNSSKELIYGKKF